jgi:hypothetical protein
VVAPRLAVRRQQAGAGDGGQRAVLARRLAPGAVVVAQHRGGAGRVVDEQHRRPGHRERDEVAVAGGDAAQVAERVAADRRHRADHVRRQRDRRRRAACSARLRPPVRRRAPAPGRWSRQR